MGNGAQTGIKNQFVRTHPSHQVVPVKHIVGRRSCHRTNPQFRQLRVVRTIHLKPRITAIHHAIPPAIIRIGVENQITARGHADKNIAAFLVQSITHIANRLRKPIIGEIFLQPSCQQASDVIFKAFLLLVGKRHVGRVSTDAQSLRVHRLNRGGTRMNLRAPKQPHKADKEHKTTHHLTLRRLA